MFPGYSEVEKTFLAISRLTNTVAAIWREKKVDPCALETQTLVQLFGERKKQIPAIWRPKNVVHNCQEQGKRL